MMDGHDLEWLERQGYWWALGVLTLVYVLMVWGHYE